MKAGTRFLHSGWGRSLAGALEELNPMPEEYPLELLTISVPIVSYEKCQQFYPHGSPWSISARHMCTAMEEENYCHGDTGGKKTPHNSIFFILSKITSVV